MTTKTMAAIAPLASDASPRLVRFRDTLASEWVKLTALRSTYITLALGIVLSIGTTALASLAIAATQDEWPADFDPKVFWLVGNIFALIVFPVFGVLAMTQEYSGGMIRLTLTATPRRGRVFCAKLILVSLITLVFGVITTVGMFLVAQVVLGAYGMPVPDVGDTDALRVVIGVGATMPFFPVIGLALGILLRSAAGAITTVLGLLWLPVIFGEVLPMWFRENVISLLPSSAVDSFTISHVTSSPTYSDPAVGAVIAGAWLVAIVGAAYLTFVRRDA